MPNAIEIARVAQQEWAALPIRVRVQRLTCLREILAANMDRILEVISAELGKPPLDVLTGDIMVTLEHCRYYERHAERLLRSRKVGKPAILYRGASFTESYGPHGVALIFAPWNYPLQLALVPAITALFAGNAVVLKCSEHAPATAVLIAKLFLEAGISADLVQVRSDAAGDAAALIDARPDIVFFTGSCRNGCEVATRAAQLLIPTILELGGKDACLVFDSCDLARAVEGVTYGAFSNAGQVCIAAKRVYVQRGIFDEFLRRFVERAGQLRIGASPDADLGPVVVGSVRKLLAEQVEDAIARGATLHSAWDRESEAVPPLILSGVPRDARLLTEESFGPVVCLQPFDDEAEGIALANDSEFALSASIYTGDGRQGERVAFALNAGTCSVNDSIRHIGNPYAAFGGNGASGNGRYHGPAGVYAFSRTRSVMTVDRPQSREVHWFPFTPKTFHQLRSLLRFRHARGAWWTRIKYLAGRDSK